MNNNIIKYVCTSTMLKMRSFLVLMDAIGQIQVQFFVVNAYRTLPWCPRCVVCTTLGENTLDLDAYSCITYNFTYIAEFVS